MSQPNQASEQSKAYKSIFSPKFLELDGGETIEIPPHPNLQMLDDDRQEAFEELLFEVESYDRGPDIYIPEQRVKDNAGNEIVLPSETRPGAILQPHRKTNPDTKQVELIKPPYTVRAVQAALGPDVYKKLRAGGRSAADVWRIWNEQGLEVSERRKVDPKSDESSDGVAVVATPDSL